MFFSSRGGESIPTPDYLSQPYDVTLKPWIRAIDWTPETMIEVSL